MSSARIALSSAVRASPSKGETDTVTVWETGQVKRVYRNALAMLTKDNDLLSISQGGGRVVTHYPTDSVIRWRVEERGPSISLAPKP